MKYIGIKHFLKYFIIIFVLLASIFMSIITIIEINSLNIRKNEVLSNEKQTIELEKNSIVKELDSNLSDLLYISDSFSFYVTSNNLEFVKNNWKVFCDKKKVYEQIRFIDVNGNEKIKVQYSPTGSYTVPDSQLESKKDKNFFKDTIKLEKGQVFVSRLDLNKKNDVVVKPIEPMIRFATPIYGNDGKFYGILILNYYAKYLLQDFQQISDNSKGSLYLLNSSGYWLYNKDENKSWGFMYKDKNNTSFKREFPYEWNNIIKDRGNVYTENGMFNYDNLTVKNGLTFNQDNLKNDRIILQEGTWYIVSYISRNSPSGYLFNDNKFKMFIELAGGYKLFFVLLAFISTIIAILFSINRYSKEKIKYFSEYDTMTDVFNRRGGMKKLDGLLKGKNKVENLCVCFIDVNGLKEVNDVFGHESGDELLVTVVDVIKRSIRKNDFIIRMGGDEFLIVFNNIDYKEAENAWSRIQREYNKINNIGQRKYIISVSHGIAEYKNARLKDLDELINLADERMYNEKKEIKKNIKIIRDI